MSSLRTIALVFAITALALPAVSGTASAHFCIDSPVAYFIDEIPAGVPVEHVHRDLDPAVAPDCGDDPAIP